MDDFRLVGASCKQFLHDAAQLGVYLWDLLGVGLQRDRPVRVDVLLSMSTRSCRFLDSDDGIRFRQHFHALDVVSTGEVEDREWLCTLRGLRNFMSLILKAYTPGMLCIGPAPGVGTTPAAFKHLW
mmetsp:Transcript_122463/g.391588  ORF Transcript_122463/g.391588 Transcript_122463/m.391588 type:complete len:126 (-) Transcript_122463:195-572(-)